MGITRNDLKSILKNLVSDIRTGNISSGYNNSINPNVTTVNGALDDLYETVHYVKPSITSFNMSPSTTTYEIGSATQSLTFTWVLNKNVTTQTLSNCAALSATARTASYIPSLTSAKTFTLTVSDGTNSASASKTINFLNKKYWGVSAIPGSYDSSFILGLSNNSLVSNRNGTVTANAGTDQYIYFCIPTSFGTPTCVIGGFETVLELAKTISFTNASGYTSNYNIYKTSQPNLGNTSLVIS